MPYSVQTYDEHLPDNIWYSEGSIYIPYDANNSDYQKMLDAIIAEGADCWDGDIPEDLQAAADAKLAAGLYQPDPHA